MDSSPLCWCSGAAINWSAVEAIGTILAVIAAAAVPLFVWLHDRKREMVRSRLDGQGLAVALLLSMIEWDRKLKRFSKQERAERIAAFAKNPALVLPPPEVQAQILNLGRLGSVGASLGKAVFQARMIEAKSAGYLDAVQGNLDAVENEERIKSLDDALKRLREHQMAAHEGVKRLSDGTSTAI